MLRLVFPALAFGSLVHAKEDNDPVREKSPSLKIESRIGTESRWSRSAGVAVKKGTHVFLKVRPITGADEIRWFQIVPDVSRFYKNANHPWEENAYKWVGFGKIDYEIHELKALRGKWEVEPLPNVIRDDAPYYRKDIGSFWFHAEVTKGGRILRSPGIEENDTRNLTPRVTRITVRENDEYLGHLTGFFNVPGLFGSIPYQCSNYIGIDCADVLVTAYNKWKKKPNKKDYNVDMLVAQWPKVATVAIEEGEPAKPLKWGTDVRRGDLIAVKYEGRSRYQHVGALHGDTDKDGALGPGDNVIHAGPEALHLTPLAAGSFDGTVAILRPK